MAIFGKDKTEVKKEEQPQGNAELNELIKALPGMIQQSVSAAMQPIAGHLQQQQQQRPAPKEEESKDPLEGIDLDNLDNKGLLQAMMQVMDHRLDGVTKSIEPKFQDLDTKFQQKSLKDELKETAGKHGDKFWAYRDEMQKLSRTYPTLAPQDLYDLARAKNPTIEQEFDKKAQEEEMAKNPDKIRSFGGLTPTSGRASSEGEKMNIKDASEKAWDEVMAEVPSEIIGGGNF